MNGSLEIRRATLSDLERIESLACEIEGAPRWSRQVWEQVLTTGLEASPGRIVLLASEAQQAVGFAALASVAGIGEVESLGTHPLHRRQGIASELCAALIRWARTHGLERLELEVRSRNAPALALYATLGFVQEGCRRAYYSSPEDDAVLMVLHLTDILPHAEAESAGGLPGGGSPV